jgi:hypothetical protein
MFKLLDAVGGESTLDYSCSLHGRIIPAEEPFLGHQLWPLLQQVLSELA